MAYAVRKLHTVQTYTYLFMYINSISHDPYQSCDHRDDTDESNDGSIVGPIPNGLVTENGRIEVYK